MPVPALEVVEQLEQEAARKALDMQRAMAAARGGPPGEGGNRPAGGNGDRSGAEDEGQRVVRDD